MHHGFFVLGLDGQSFNLALLLDLSEAQLGGWQMYVCLLIQGGCACIGHCISAVHNKTSLSPLL